MVVTRLMTTLLFVALPAAAFDEPATETGAAGSESARSSASARSPAKSPVPASIRLLGDPRFEVREEATKTLEQAGIAAIVPLREAAAGENLEITCRAIRSLAAILDTNDEPTFDAAEAAFEQLEASANTSAARRATMALGSQALRRWKRAVVLLKQQGGGVKWKNRLDSGLPDPNPELGGNALPANVMLGENWSGGTPGLTNIKRMMYALQTMVNSGTIPPIALPLPIYVIDGADVSAEALEELQQSLPGLEIQTRGRAKLGVYCESRAGPCTISDVEPKQAAEKAGLRKRDVVIRYDGETVADFEQLTRITRRHNVADRVKLEVDRDGQIVELEVELSGWDELKPEAKEK